MGKANGCRFWWALALAVSLGGTAQAVELLGEQEMGGVDVYAGDVLSILGPTAAGEVLPDMDADAALPPIERTSGQESAIAMALGLNARERSLRPLEVRDDLDAVTRLFPARQVPIMIERNVPSPGPTDGGASFRILPGERNITASIEPQPGGAPDGLRTIHDTRVDEIRISDVSFPQGGVGLEGETIVISGLVVQADALITER